MNYFDDGCIVEAQLKQSITHLVAVLVCSVEVAGCWFHVVDIVRVRGHGLLSRIPA